MPSSAQPTVDVCEWLNRHKIGWLQIVVLCLCGACTFFAGFDASNIAYATPVLLHDLDLSQNAVAPAFMAELLGLVAGCLVVAPLADRIGRKPVLLGSLIGFSVFTLATGASWSIASLCVFRCLAGAGVGGGMAVAIAFASEFLPERNRAGLTVAMIACFPLGASLGSAVAALIVATAGWEFVFFAGGILPLFVAMAIAFLLPESVRHLVVHRVDSDRIAGVLTQINHRCVFLAKTRFVVREEAQRGLPVLHLFRKGRAVGTLLVWTVAFMGLLGISLAMNGLPVLLDHLGLLPSRSFAALAMLLLCGGALSVVVAPLIDRHGMFVILLPAYLVAAVGIATFGAIDDGALLLAASALAGIGIVSGLSVTNAFAAAFYPTCIRATGLGWALGIGIAGAAMGYAAGAVLPALHLSRAVMFLVGTVPELAAFAAVLALMRLERVPTRALGEPQVSTPL